MVAREELKKPMLTRVEYIGTYFTQNINIFTHLTGKTEGHFIKKLWRSDEITRRYTQKNYHHKPWKKFHAYMRWTYSITATTGITESIVKWYHICWKKRRGILGNICYRRRGILILIFCKFTSVLIWVMSCVPTSFPWRVPVAHTLSAIL